MHPAHTTGNDAPLSLQRKERQNSIPIVGVNDEIRRTGAFNFNGPRIVFVRLIKIRL